MGEGVDPRFAAISPPHKKWYVAANIAKAFYLAVISVSSKYARGVYNCISLDEYPRLELKRSDHVYVATDLVALFLVPKLPISTIMYHVATTGLVLMVSCVNLEIKGWAGLLGVSVPLLRQLLLPGQRLPSPSSDLSHIVEVYRGTL